MRRTPRRRRARRECGVQPRRRERWSRRRRTDPPKRTWLRASELHTPPDVLRVFALTRQTASLHCCKQRFPLVDQDAGENRLTACCEGIAEKHEHLEHHTGND